MSTVPLSFGAQALQVLRTVAPTIALAVGGPFGPLAATAISAVLGTAPGDSKAAETALLSATPDQLLALKKAENDFTVQMQTLGIQQEQLVFADITDARDMQTKVHSPWPGILSLVTTLAIVLEIGFRTAGIMGAQDPVTAQLVGTLQAGWIACLSYWVGSTRQAAVNQNAIADIAKGP